MIRKISDFIGTKKYLKVLLVFSLFFIIFILAYLNVGALSSGDDHFFHIRFAQRMLDNGFFNSFENFQAISLSDMAQGGKYYVYYNFLFYLALIPFTYLTPLFIGIKLYAIIIASLAFTILYWCCSRLGIRNPLIWIIIIFSLTNYGAIWRLFLSRPYALAPVLLLLLLIFLHRNKYFAAFFLGIFYFFWHSATFFFPLGVATVFFISKKFYKERASYKIILFPALSLIFSLVVVYLISPGFLNYMKDIIFGVFTDTIIGKKVILSEGVELYPVDFFDFIKNNMIVVGLILMLGSLEIYQYIVFRFRANRTTDYLDDLHPNRSLQLTLFTLTFGTLLGTTSVSGRFGDFFVFFAAMYLILSLNQLRQYIHITHRDVRRGATIGLVITLIYFFGGNVLFLQQNLSRGATVEEFAGVGGWLKINTKPGDTIFNANWSWFPQLYYHSPKNNYLTGLEPRFSYSYSPKLYWLWWNISTRGYVCEEEKCPEKDKERALIAKKESEIKNWYKKEGDLAAEILLKDLKTSYVVTSRNHPFLNGLLTESDRFEKVFGDWTNYSVYKVN